MCRSRDDTYCTYLIAHILVPPEVLGLKGQRGELGQTDCKCAHTAVATKTWLNARSAAVNFSEYDSLPCGQVSLINRVKYAPHIPIDRQGNS